MKATYQDPNKIVSVILLKTLVIYVSKIVKGNEIPQEIFFQFDNDGSPKEWELAFDEIVSVCKEISPTLLMPSPSKFHQMFTPGQICDGSYTNRTLNPLVLYVSQALNYDCKNFEAFKQLQL